ncbi:hypothetical protein EBR57_09570 [bacterium]|nr:hypothetical protein [bacterium]
MQPFRRPQTIEHPYRATPTIPRPPDVAMPDIDLPEPSALRSRPTYHRPFVSRFTQAFGLLTGTVRLLQSERDFERTVSFSAARASLQPTINRAPPESRILPAILQSASHR